MLAPRPPDAFSRIWKLSRTHVPPETRCSLEQCPPIRHSATKSASLAFCQSAQNYLRATQATRDTCKGVQACTRTVPRSSSLPFSGELVRRLRDSASSCRPPREGSLPRCDAYSLRSLRDQARRIKSSRCDARSRSSTRTSNHDAGNAMRSQYRTPRITIAVML